MQKQVNFFEQNVQWFALGLGALFLLFMAYTYLLQRPVVVQVENKQLGPGEIEQVTLEGPVADLRRDIGRNTVPEIRIIDYVDAFVAAIEGPKEQLASLSGTQIRSIGSGGIDDIRDGGTQIAEGEPVKALPKPPAARPSASLDGRSTVSFEDPNWVPRPNRPNEPPPLITADKDWVSLLFTINGEALAKAWRDAFDEDKLLNAGLDPNDVWETAFVDVVLIRQEILPGAKLGKEVVVKQLLNNKRPPFPAKDAPDIEVQNYLNYVTQTPDDLIKPPFYIVEAGDPWMAPGEQANQLIAQNRAAAREQMKMEAEARRAAMQQQRDQARAAQAQRRQARVGAANQFDDVEGGMDEQEFFVPDQLVPDGGRAPTYVPPALPGARRGQPARTAVPVAGPAVIGPGRFKVSEDMGNIEIIAHDDEVQAGKTYRYKLRYRLFNPVWKSVGAARPELTKQFAITAPDSAWSDNVKIRDKVEFFLAELKNDRAEFDIFYWEKGKMQKDRISATPGDAIGKTGWTLVDIRGRGRGSTGLLMNDLDGRVYPRETESGRNDRYEQLLFEVELDQEQLSATE